MTTSMLAIAALLVSSLAMLPGQQGPTSSSSREEVLYLCQALTEAMPGERVPVLLDGVMLRAFERQAFFDPEQPLCPWDVQSSTWVEFSSSTLGFDELLKILNEIGQAHVTIRGVLYGPPPVPPDSPSVPGGVAYVNRLASRRYGHLGGFRTKLVVEEVLSATPASRKTAEQVITHRPSEFGRLAPLTAEVPQYPEIARKAGIVGEVVVRVVVEDGEVTSTELISGDRILAMAARTHVQSWTFAKEVSATFSTMFTYRLEMKPTGATEASTVELQLPWLVRITAPYYGW